ncbi:hypothetical protein Leryth_002992, partial [Lithospermum erythrorhizon]
MKAFRFLEISEKLLLNCPPTCLKHYPELDDEKLYQHARLVTLAVIAKVHTIDWTVELFKRDALLAGMRLNWYGFLGKSVKDLIGHKFGHITSGLTKRSWVPYSLTEEFVSVYRMHSLLPEKIVPRDIHRSSDQDIKTLPIEQEVRERGVARYNEFRRNLLMVTISTWEDLTEDEQVIKALHEVYGDDVEKLDVMVGLHAEKKIKGYAISETAFALFLLMASRRLEADRFFITNFNGKSYTEEGLEWVNKTETLKDILDRHFPDMTKKWMTSTSAFSVWDGEHNPRNYLPLYL